MIAKVRKQELSLVLDQLAALLKYYEKGEEEKMVMQMKRMVPEYKSNNSVFEKYDQGAMKKTTTTVSTPAFLNIPQIAPNAF